ncbi:MAG: hypothetical protein COB67_04845 [SAR324 cluster bacterium]|uniref:histidine kinase n=1 Tax=SAR324 cluster bacterium TaxID=2024889 RepID=A0A2A4T6X2_9DELT|nr:MAG: hypothetical protein COB67_04845 [SAR324 cluster bacterium]
MGRSATPILNSRLPQADRYLLQLSPSPISENSRLKFIVIFRFFLIFFVPLWLLGGGTLSLFYYVEVKSRVASLEQNERHLLALQKKIVSDDFQLLLADLRFLAEQNELQQFLNGQLKAKKMIGLEYQSFSNKQRIYDQIRYIDGSGREVVRVNKRGHESEIVPYSRLQFKGDRYYFQKTNELFRGDVFVSPFDLNMENGVLEYPPKPTIRFGTPVYDYNNQKQGIIVFNYLGEALLQKLRREVKNYPGEIMLLNSQGYWLLSSSEDEEWGFMFSDERKNFTFKNAYPAVWQEISKNLEGQLVTERGMFTYSTVFPELEVLKSLSDMKNDEESAVYTSQGSQNYWKIVSFIPQNILQVETNPLLEFFLKTFFFLSLLLLLISLLPTFVNIKRFQAEQALKAVNDGLEYRVNQRTQELRSTNHQLRKEIVERKFAEEEVIKTLKELSDMKFALDEAAIVVITDPQGILTYVNDKYCEITKYSRKELLGTSLSVINSADFAQEVASGKIWRGTFKNKNRDGIYYWVDTTVVPFMDESNQPLQYVVIHSDLTEIKRAESLLQQDMLENFASGLAHEIGNPLGAMRMKAQTMQEDLDEDSELWDDLDDMVAEIDRLNNIVRKFNALGRPSPPNFSNHNPRDLFIGLLPLIESEVKQKEIQLATHFEDEIGDMWADSQQIQQVLLNLVVNSFQAMPSGGNLTLRVRAIEKEQVEFVVQDSGMGISKDYLERIFEPFFTTKANGSGFGLSLANSTVKQNGGVIKVESQLGAGAAFSLTFPLSQELD